MDILNKTNIQNKILRAPEFGDDSGGGGASSTPSNAVFIGGVEVDKFYLGNSDDVKIFLGDVKLYPRDITYKLVAQYSDTTEYKVECNSSTSLTQTEVTSHTTPVSSMTSAVVSDCVNRIDSNSFCGATNLNSVTLNEGITEIGSQAFRDTPNLRSITFPSTLDTIEATAFRLSGLRNVSGIPSGVTYLGSGAFADCTSLTAATIPSSVTGSSTNLFLRDTALKEVHFERETAPELGADAFNGCTSLIKIYIPDCDCYDSYAAQSQFSGKTNIIYAEDNTKCYVPPHVYFNYLNGQYERGGFSYTANTDGNLTKILKTASSSGELTTCKIAASGVTSVKFTQVNAVSGSGFYYSATIDGTTTTAYTNSSGAVQEFTGLSKDTTYYISVTLRKKTNGSGISGTNASANITWTQ